MHAYTPESIRRAIAAGVKCIEHGHLMDEPTAKLIAENGIWLSTQAFPDEMADAFPPGSSERAKALEVFAGTKTSFQDPALKWIEGWPGQDLQPHQADVIGKAATIMKNISAAMR